MILRCCARFVLVVALAAGAAFGVLLGAVPAGAVNYTSCGSLSGVDATGQIETLGACNGPTGGSGTFVGPVASPLTVTWSGGGTSTISFTIKVLRNDKCTAGSTEMGLAGHVRTSTGAATSIRGMFFARICVDPDENLSLAPGHTVLLETR